MLITGYLLSGNEVSIPSHLYISYRYKFTEIPKPSTLILLEAADEENSRLFVSYIEYFSSRERAGFVQFDKLDLYLVPPGHSDRFHSGVPSQSMLAVCCEKI